MKKRTDSILDNPLRTPSSSGSGTNPSAINLDVEKPHAGPDRDDLMRFHCAHGGGSACAFEARGKSEEELMVELEKHLRETHNQQLDEGTRAQIRESLQNRNAA